MCLILSVILSVRNLSEHCALGRGGLRYSDAGVLDRRKHSRQDLITGNSCKTFQIDEGFDQAMKETVLEKYGMPNNDASTSSQDRMQQDVSDRFKITTCIFGCINLRPFSFAISEKGQ